MDTFESLLDRWLARKETLLPGLINRALTRHALFAGGYDKSDLVKLLVEHGAVLTEPDSNGYTPLQACIKKREYPLAHGLVRLGAGDTPCSENGETALMVLIENKVDAKRAMSLVDLLVETGADIHAVNTIGQGVCHKSVIARNRHLLSRFLELWALPDLPDKTGNTPVRVAAQSCFVQNLKSLLACLMESNDPVRQLRIFDFENPTNSLLVLNTDEGSLEILKILIEFEQASFRYLRGSEKEGLRGLRDALYTEALCNSIQKRSLACFRCLLSRMDNISSVDSSGFTPLHIAAREEDKNYVADLLKKGAEVNAKTANGAKTASDIACAGRSTSALLLLLAHGAEPRPEYLTLALDRNNYLDLAVALVGRGIELQREHLQLVGQRRFSTPLTRLLLDYGAKVQPHHLDMGVRTGDFAFVKDVLSAYPQDTDRQVRAIIAARMAKNTALIDLLVDYAGQRISSTIAEVDRDTAGGTFLHSAARTRRTDMMWYILAGQGVGSEIMEARDDFGDTPLMVAMKTYRWESAELLIRCGANTHGVLDWAHSRGVSVWDTHRIDRLVAQGPLELLD